MAGVIVIGGGWAGCAAALAAARQGARVTLLERSDMLLGTGLVGGIYRNNGRLTALLEAEALGCSQLFSVMDSAARHQNIAFPGHNHASLYDVALVEPLVRQTLTEAGVNIRFCTRGLDVTLKDDRILEVLTADGDAVAASAFVDATGTAGGQSNCSRFGNGCVMCIIRCPAFGPRVSIAAKAGVLELMGIRGDGRPGSMSGSCKILKDSLSPLLRMELDEKGVLVIPLPPALRGAELEYKACQQYNLPAYRENLIILDTGHAKLMSSFFPLEKLRTAPGFENARFEDPYAGGIGNSIRYTAVSQRDNRLKVMGLENLFCAGEKAGFIVGHTEAIITGSLAGHNAAALAADRELLVLPVTLACGDLIDYANTAKAKRKEKVRRITFSGSEYFERMLSLDLYTVDREVAAARVERAGLSGVFNG
ncbi:MAG: FAD-dependent oxidoreductase [Dethiobacter sp.]|nr:FAD-dependent oxidoreductase [Dethiobacter sp.]